MKLSKAQQEVMQKARQCIDRARACETFEEYYEKYEAPHIGKAYRNPDNLKRMSPDYYENILKGYHDECNAIVGTHCNTRTLRKLEELGLIVILYDSTGQAVGLDKIKVLNY